MKTYVYIGKDFQLLLEAKSKQSAINKVKRILKLSKINEGRVGVVIDVKGPDQIES